MGSGYPGSIDNFAEVGPTDTTTTAVGGRTHRQSHNDMGDAIEAVQTELGTTPSGDAADVAERLDGIEDGTRLFPMAYVLKYNGSAWPVSRPDIPAGAILILDCADYPAVVPPAWATPSEWWLAAPSAPWGSSSPIDLLQASDYPAAGVILVGNGAGSVVALAAPTVTGLALVADLTQPAKVKWANAIGLAPTVTKTGNYTATVDDHTIRCDTTSGNITISLPAAAGNAGRIFVIKKVASANTVTIDPSGAETIDGSSTASLSANYEHTRIQCNGTGWDVI